jgi:hypothetical protein
VIRATRITLSNKPAGIDFVSASSAVHVQTSPAPLAFISALQFFLSRDERPNLAKYLNSN